MLKILICLFACLVFSQRLLALDFLEIEKQYGSILKVSISHASQEDDQDLQGVLKNLTGIIGGDFNTTVDTKFAGNKTYLMDSGILDLKKYAYEGYIYNINLTVAYKDKAEGSYVVEAKVYDVKNELVLAGKKYSFKLDAIRKVAHVISDVAYYTITGKRGYFQSKILFSSSELIKTPASRKSIYVIDQDGYGEVELIAGGMLTMPTYDSKRNIFAYVDMTSGEPTIQSFSPASRSREKISSIYPVLTQEKYSSTPAFCESGDCMFFTRIGTQGSDIWKVSSSGLIKVTSSDKVISTSPSPSPDASAIVFESGDSNGRRNLYIAGVSMIDGKRILAGNDGVYAEPRWSPDGDWIAFTKIRNGLFHLGIIKPDGTEEQILYSSYMLENPTWMPNSDAILFSEKKSLSSRHALVMIDLTGRVVREIKTNIGATSPNMMVIR